MMADRRLSRCVRSYDPARHIKAGRVWAPGVAFRRPRKEETTMGARSALLIGVARFAVNGSGAVDEDGEVSRARLRPLPYSRESDALAEVLHTFGYRRTAPGEPTSDDIGRSVLHAVETAGPDDVVIIHVLSHGEMDEGADALYVIGADGARSSGADVVGWLRKLAMTTARGRPETRPYVLFLLDICHAGTATRLEQQIRRAADPGRTWGLGAWAGSQRGVNDRFTRADAEGLRSG